MYNKELTGILDILLRSLISVIILFILTRIMGKKQIAQLTFFDYIVGISMGSIGAAFATDDRIEYSHGIAALIIYAIVPILVSYISMKSLKWRSILGSKPTILIQNGKLIENNLKKSKMHINDVLEECRIQGAFSFRDVEFAILETSGRVSVQLIAPKQPLTPVEMKIKTDYKGLSADIIIDGEVLHEHLILLNHDVNWLLKELKKQKISSPREVLLATLDSDGKIYIDLKNHDPIVYDVID